MSRNGSIQGPVREIVSAVIVVLDDVLYPAKDYQRDVCRAGADVLRRFLGVDVAEALADYYLPGAEELAVVAALAETMPTLDDRLIAKIAALMAVHRPRIAPYEDALEVFGMLRVMGVRLGLIGDGPPLAQRMVVDELGAGRVFQQIVMSHDLLGDTPWNDSLSMMETLLDCPLSDSALVCARRTQAIASADRVRYVYRVQRSQDEIVRPALPNLIELLNLYDLPEALGWVAPVSSLRRQTD